MNTEPNIAVELRQMSERIREMFPGGETVHLNITAGSGLCVGLHQVGDYSQGTALMQRLGVGERKKAILDENTEHPWSTLEGERDGVLFTVFCGGLPPSCKVVIESKKIPKSEVRETGEFIEVFDRRVVCGGAS